MASSIVDLAQLAASVCSFLKKLHQLMGTLPGRLDSLNNEVTDLEIVLNQVAAIIEQRETERRTEVDAKRNADQRQLSIVEVESHVDTDDDTRMAEVVGRARCYLTQLRAIILVIEKAGENTKVAKLARIKVFRSNLDRLNALESNIRNIKSTLNLFIGTYHTNQLRRHHVELLSVSLRGFQAQFSNQQHTDSIMSTILQHIGSVDHGIASVNDRIESMENSLRQQAERQSHRAALTVSSNLAVSTPTPPRSLQQHTIHFHVASRASSCRIGCMCSCHVSRPPIMPSILDRVIGQLFVRYSGIPGLSVKCDVKSCAKTRKPQMHAEYWFPAGLVWSMIIRFTASYHSKFGPSFQLSTLRRIPDDAEAVTFAMTGNIDGLKNLFTRGFASPVDISETRGYSLLRWALYSKQYKTCKFLFDAGADPDYRPKAQSDNSPRNKASDLILQGGLPDEALDALLPMTRDSYWIEEQNFTRLHKIVTGLIGGSLEEELENNPDCINETDAMGRTALLWAAARGNDRVIATLLNYGADPNIIDCQLSGPVAYSADRNHTVATRLLLEAGALADVIIPGGYKVGSPLNCATRNASDPLLIKTLLDFGADVDACGADGRTSLIHAARVNNDAFAFLLIEAGADINAISLAGQTPLTTAIACNSHEVLQMLLDRWEEYHTCPRLIGPHLLRVAAQYADLKTVMILTETDHFKLKIDNEYSLGDFEAIMARRHDVDDELKWAFTEFISIVRCEKLSEEVQETGSCVEAMEKPDPESDSDTSEEYLDAPEYPNASDIPTPPFDNLEMGKGGYVRV